MIIINIKEKVYNIVTKFCNENNDSLEKMGVLTQYISDTLGLKRNFASRLLNELHKDGKLIKINTRPVIFIAKEAVEEKLNIKLLGDLIYEGFNEIEEQVLLPSYVDNSAQSISNKDEAFLNPFSKLAGFDGSLRYQVEQCKAAIRYPNNGLPILITGPTGSGKSFLAEIMSEYAKNKNLVREDAPFHVFNCAEYANNPELLSANLFGYMKGAFTGAEKDSKGIIEEADGGFLFLDEIHRLPPEGQEKLFLFMDKGIFRRLGESKDTRTSSVRFIFATTEKIEDFLISTFLRRIPIVISIPSLKDRPLNEKFSLIYNFFTDEAKALNKELQITRQAMKTILYFDYKGNVGQLRNSIKLSCARAYNDYCNSNSKNSSIEITFLDLPDYLMKNMTMDYTDNMEIINIIKDELLITPHSKKEIKLPELVNERTANIFAKFYSELLSRLEKHLLDGLDDFDKLTIVIDDFFDKVLVETDFEQSKYLYYEKMNMVHTTIHKAFELIKNRYDITYYDSIGHKIACYIMKSVEELYFPNINEFDSKFSKYFNELKNTLKKEYTVVKKLAEFLNSNIDIKLNTVQFTILMIYLKGITKNDDEKRIKAVIIAHGYYTASSIANIANYLLGEKIFESFDMPVEVKSNEIVKKLRNYLEEIDISKGLIILVDMGSLEEIYEGLEEISHGVIGIVNNITTQLALDTGSCILQGLSVEEIIKKITLANTLRYQLIKPKGKKENALIVTCITGIGTATKIKNLLVKSLGSYSKNIKIIAHDYINLKNNNFNDGIFSEYNIVSIIGTKDPKIDNIPFFSLEDIISGKKEQSFSNVLKCVTSEEGIQQINQSILKYFSLESVLNYITILNPNKIVDQIEMAIDSLQYEMKRRFTNSVKICLYVHLSCLIERLITRTQIDDYNSEALITFNKCHSDFIDAVKSSFSVIEKLYSVSIPLAEIYFIYEVLDAKIEEFKEDAK